MTDKSVSIRRVKAGDEDSLAYVQTESWKEAFREIVPADILSQCTEIERAAEMYKMLLAENKGNGYILELDGRPHCIAWWDAAREENMRGFAELICIHSLRDNWHKGYGKMTMERVLDDVRRDIQSSCSGYLTAMCGRSGFMKRTDSRQAEKSGLPWVR